MRLTYLAIFLIFAGITATGHAQQQQGQNTLLPEIDPQDIEIRSQFRARFPGLTRQPILGFDPNPRVFQIDPNRMPFMESRDDVVASLPVSELSRPAPPGYVPLSYSGPINAFARAGFGSFATPEAQFWGVYKPTNRSYVGGDLDYVSAIEGHLDDRPGTFRNLRVNGEFGTKPDERTQLDLFAGGRSDFNYSAGYPFGSLGPDTDFGRRLSTGVHVGSELRRMRNGVQGWEASAEFRTFTTDVLTGADNTSGNEGVYRAGGRYQWAGGHPRETWQLKAGVRGGYFSQESGENGNWNTLHAAAIYDRLFNYRTRVTAEAGVYYVSNTVESKALAGPKLTVRHWLSDKLTVELQGAASPRLYSRQELYGRNRFLRAEQELVHTYDIRGSAEVSFNFFDESRIYGGASYRYGDNNPVFAYEGPVDPDEFSLLPGRYQVYFDDVTVARLYGGISHALVPETVWFSAEGYLQVPRLKDDVGYHDGNRVPFMETWGINGSLSFRPIDRVTLEGWADLLGAREPNEAAGEKLDPVFLLGGQVDIEILDHFGVYAKFVNLLSQEYQMWYGYTERPLQVFGGVTLKL